MGVESESRYINEEELAKVMAEFGVSRTKGIAIGRARWVKLHNPDGSLKPPSTAPERYSKYHINPVMRTPPIRHQMRKQYAKKDMGEWLEVADDYDFGPAPTKRVRYCSKEQVELTMFLFGVSRTTARNRLYSYLSPRGPRRLAIEKIVAKKRDNVKISEVNRYKKQHKCSELWAKTMLGYLDTDKQKEVGSLTTNRQTYKMHKGELIEIPPLPF